MRPAGFAIRSRIAVFRLALPILGDGEELMGVSERTREGWRIAIVWATIPLTDWPTKWAVYQPNASSVVRHVLQAIGRRLGAPGGRRTPRGAWTARRRDCRMGRRQHRRHLRV